MGNETDYTVKHIDEMERTFSGGLVKARAELGVSAFGMAVEDFPPNFDGYPEHDHAHDSQEEVYIVLSGSATVTLDGQTFDLDQATMVRVGPSVKRKFNVGPEGLRLLALGGVPGEVYSAAEWSELGSPDPTAG